MCQLQPNAAFWNDVIDKHLLEIANDVRATLRWKTQGHQGATVIYLSLVNQPLIK